MVRNQSETSQKPAKRNHLSLPCLFPHPLYSELSYAYSYANLPLLLLATPTASATPTTVSSYSYSYSYRATPTFATPNPTD